MISRDNPGAPLSPRALPSSSLFEHFPARPYLEKYYSYVGDENAAMLNALMDGVRRLRPVMEHVVEVGGGPSVVPLLAMTAAAGRAPGSVTFVDIGDENLNETWDWQRGSRGAFEYEAVYEWLSRHVDNFDPAAVLRASNWAHVRHDFRIPLDARGRFDTVSSHFFAESATSDEAEFLILLRNLRALAAPDAVFLLSFMRRSHGYSVAGIDFPAIPVDEDTLPALLDQAGIFLRDSQYSVTPVETPPTRSGYEGMVFLTGRLDEP